MNKHTRLFPRMTFIVMDNFAPTLASVSTIVSMATTVVLGLESRMSRIQDGESIRTIKKSNSRTYSRHSVLKHTSYSVFLCDCGTSNVEGSCNSVKQLYILFYFKSKVVWPSSLKDQVPYLFDPCSLNLFIVLSWIVLYTLTSVAHWQQERTFTAST